MVFYGCVLYPAVGDGSSRAVLVAKVPTHLREASSILEYVRLPYLIFQQFVLKAQDPNPVTDQHTGILRDQKMPNMGDLKRSEI